MRRQRRPRAARPGTRAGSVADLLGHLAADEHAVRTAAEMLEDAELVLDLRAAGDEHERPLDLVEEPPRASSSRSISRPAYAGSSCATPSVDACARCDDPNASLT